MSNKHQSSGMRKVVKQLRKLGVIMQQKKNGTMLSHPKANSRYLMHYSEKAIHEVRRWVKRELKVDVKY